jgi:prevent-host-death family protein
MPEIGTDTATATAGETIEIDVLANDTDPEGGPLTVTRAFDAKTHLAALLDRVAAGEEIVITKRGRPVARLVPPAGAKAARREGAWRRIAALRASVGADWTGEEILAARDAGRR